MSYCVNCGVELQADAGRCPLCDTIVINPNELEKLKGEQAPFPSEKGQVEDVKRKDIGILLTVILAATGIICGILNALSFQGALWSLAVGGVCIVLWVILIPVVIFKKQPVYVSLLLDGVAVAAYLYMLTYLVESDRWYFGLGLPITVLVTVIAELFTVCVKKLPYAFIVGCLEFFTAVGLLCMGIEIMIDRYLGNDIILGWSAVVLTVCGILDIAFITMLSQRRLRHALYKRLHLK
ncbi:MAG: DUF6320 domain-containing protein [Eubacterium sp.]|nr:DUF6320 domain-containing protein [Eubacterium sp.]MCM1220125.1 DUF6320 domain-containing protein [Lachnospiraceae bacterium]MCM1303966.1 DUF6320 domain-containing protein [Butyrivibrio sp.]MCM1343521.1 DUF6320 domain-containing protein [Muribaculaceae bacterium]MCM1240669.1 DUF6320 domain-containing protein [Lachnospiraceae bacterium]